MLKWKNPLLTLGERCVLFSENELSNGVKESSPGSYTSPRIAEYFSICTREKNGVEIPIGITKGNWCAASASFALHECLLPGEIEPHGFRVGVVEVKSDLQKQGRWHSKKEVLDQKYNIQIGDPVIFDRSQPGKPETSWWRHIGRVYDVTSEWFECISGNSYGKWRISKHKKTQSNLLGFGEYPGINSKPTGVPSEGVDWSNVDVEDLVPLVDTGRDLEVDNFFSIYDRIFGRNL